MHCGVHCRLFHWFLGKCFFGGSASLHDLFLHFLAKCFIIIMHILVVIEACSYQFHLGERPTVPVVVSPIHSLLLDNNYDTYASTVSSTIAS